MFSDYIVFVDESGDHGMVRIDQTYPIFVLAFCIFRKQEYAANVCPSVQRFKFKHWGHDAVVLHEHDIRKPRGPFSFLQNTARREAFMEDLNTLMEATPFELIASVIRKPEFSRLYHVPKNPYSIALEFGLERLFRHLQGLQQADRITHVVVERRGKHEDFELESEFRRICDGANYHNRPLPFEILMAPKDSNATGMQLADLVARPIGAKVLRPNQPNRAYEILERKFRRGPRNEIEGWGLKIFP